MWNLGRERGGDIRVKGYKEERHKEKRKKSRSYKWASEITTGKNKRKGHHIEKHKIYCIPIIMLYTINYKNQKQFILW